MPAPSATSWSTASPARRTTSPGTTSAPTAMWLQPSCGTWASRGRWSGRSRIGRATTAATPWTAPSSPPWAGRTRCPSRRVCRQQWTGISRTRIGGAASSPGSGRTTTSASTGLGWPAPARPGESVARMRVAVTGAGGRLGTSLVKQLTESAAIHEVLAWDLPVHNLDDPLSARRLVTLHRPDVVIHAAAWTDVDGCARDPELAMRRNGTAAGEMAQACADAAAALVVVSTNEVFDGRRTDGLSYGPTDPTNPGNPYGAAKLAGEQAARAAYGASDEGFAVAAAANARELGNAPAVSPMPPPPALAIVRTAWLCGLPGVDFPQK